MTFIPFSQIIGQERALRLLSRAMEKERLPHAYLFVGISGIGKKTTALALTRAINCQEDEKGEGCGRCRSCRQIMNGNFPDYVCIKPERNYIRIERIRELNRSFGFKPVSGRYRVSVIQEAEKMTDEAANAFLKNLEEPPDGNILILSVADPLDLLPTIVSRCQKVGFRPIPSSLILERLLNENNFDRETALLVAKVSNGSLGRALKMSESDFLEKRQDFLSRFTRLQGLEEDQVLELAVDLARRFKKKSGASDGEDEVGLLDLLNIWKSWYRDLLLFRIKASEDYLVNIDFVHTLKNISKNLRIKNLIESFSILDQAQRDLTRNRNMELLLEDTILKLKRLSH